PSSIDSNRCFISGAKTPSVPPAFLPAYKPSIASCLKRSKSNGVFSFINMSLDISNLTIYSFYPVTQLVLHSQALQLFLSIETTRPIFGRVAFDNFGSRKVLVKCGFSGIGSDFGFADARQTEVEEFIYKLDS